MAEVISWIVWSANLGIEADDSGYHRMPRRHGTPEAKRKEYVKRFNEIGTDLRTFGQDEERYGYITRWSKDWKQITVNDK
jgi:hypothetical protein